MKKRRTTHLLFGILFFVIFLLTGQFMRHVALVSTLDSTPRALYRAGHIYILFSGFLHVLLGLYIQKAGKGWRYGIQILASLLLFGASVLLLYSFFTEHPAIVNERPWSRLGIYISLAGIIGHLMANLPKYSRTQSENFKLTLY